MEAAYFDKRFTLTSASMLSRTPLGLAFACFREFDDQFGERHGYRIVAIH